MLFVNADNSGRGRSIANVDQTQRWFPSPLREVAAYCDDRSVTLMLMRQQGESSSTISHSFGCSDVDGCQIGIAS